MKHALIALTCVAALSGAYLTQASQNDKDTQPRATPGTTCQGEVRGGKIIGEPGPRSKFRNLRLGMSQYAVQKQIGVPDDMGHRATGKAFRPFYYGTDRVRVTHYYRGSGTLVYSGSGSDTLIEIHHDARESGDRSRR